MKIFIGYDSREKEAYEVCKYSLQKFNQCFEIIPLVKDEIKEFNRQSDSLSSTDFTYTRFLVPFLSGYKDVAIYCDCDFLWLDDPIYLFNNSLKKFAVSVVKHDYVPVSQLKMDSKIQTIYPRKNWSSMIVWNCEHPLNRILTPDVVNTVNPQYLHRFQWLTDSHIGELGKEWNWLVGYYKEPRDGNPKALHYTDGGPWFNNYKNCEYSELWLQELGNAQITK